MKKKFLLITIAFLFCSVTLIAQVTDKDGNNYKTVKIGKQEWMAENLNVSHFRNGDLIPEMEDVSEWMKAGKEGRPAWCYYNNDTSNARKYFKLYNMCAVNDPRGLAPDGWHIPSESEWNELAYYLEGRAVVAATKMKAANGWNGTNESGFSGLPGGFRGPDGTYTDIGLKSNWWTSGNISTTLVVYQLDDTMGLIFKMSPNYFKAWGLSVRCIKD